ncbi:MAG: hypothetical protein RIQ52_189 [Pseudomonadota bacterium]
MISDRYIGGGMDDSLLRNLRAATADLHRNLEKTSLVRGLLTDIQLHDYIRFMHILSLIYARHEDAARCLLVRHGLLFPDTWPAMFPVIEADRRRLELEPDKPQSQRETQDNIDTLAAALGCLYVLEGALVGRQALARIIENRTDWHGRYDLHFHQVDHASCLQRWRDFEHILHQPHLGHTDMQMAADAAVALFNDFIQAING